MIIMFGYSIVRTKKLEQLYASSVEIATANQRLRAQNDRLVRYCHRMARKLRDNNLKIPEWWFIGL